VEPATRSAVRDLLVSFIENWLSGSVDPAELDSMRVLGISPSGLLAPFHEALVPGITLLRERSFSTSLGNLHERVAELIAGEHHAEAQRQYQLDGSMPAIVESFITQHLHALESGEVKPDWRSERAELLRSFGQTVTASTRIDLRVVTHEGSELLFEMKSAKPNKGQCIEMKQRLMKAVAIRGSTSTFAHWGVPYDPYGEGHYGHPYPKRFFDFAHEVMVGRDFWDVLGGDGTYVELIDVYQDVGRSFAERLRSLTDPTA